MPEEDQPDAYLLKRFDVTRQLGKGAYGIVWKVIEKETGKVMALKRCFDAFQNATDAQRTFREIMFLQALNGHDNIVRLMGVLKAESIQDIYVLFDYMETDLQHVVTANMLEPIHMEYITYQVLKAMKYVHSGGVLHRDLKPANVLLNSNCHVRICDFGLARTAAPPPVQPGAKAADSMQAPSLLTDYVATRWYRAPELLLSASFYNESVDMWSVGCIIAEMVCGKPILKGRSTMDQLEKIVELTGKPTDADMKPITSSSPYARTMIEQLGNVGKVPFSNVVFLTRAGPVARSLILSLLRFNPDRRPSAETALEDPFVEKFHLQETEPICEKIIRMPIPDASKLKAGDYRSHIYGLIGHRKKMAREDADAWDTTMRSLVGSEVSCAPRSSARSGRRPSKDSIRSLADEQPQPVGPWCNEGGTTAPATTPRLF